MLDSSGPAGQTSTSTAPVGGGALGAVASPGSLNLARLPVDPASHAIFAAALTHTPGSTSAMAARRLAVRLLAESWDTFPIDAYGTGYQLMFCLMAVDEPEANVRFGNVLCRMGDRQRIDHQYAIDPNPQQRAYRQKRDRADRLYALALDEAVA